MDKVCFDFQSLYSFPSPRLDLSRFAAKMGIACHYLISTSRNVIFNKNIVTTSDNSYSATVMYQDKSLSEKMRSISEDVVKNKLCLVTLKDTYENISDFLFNDSIILIAHTKLKEDVGEFEYYKTARSSMTGTSTENYISDLLSSPFYISGIEKSSRYTYDASSVLAKEIDKQILLEILGISSKLRQEYKVKGVFYYTTVLFYANNSVKTFCDIEVGDKNNYYLTCQETLDLINKKEEN